jgi:hypothetical protein
MYINLVKKRVKRTQSQEFCHAPERRGEAILLLRVSVSPCPRVSPSPRLPFSASFLLPSADLGAFETNVDAEHLFDAAMDFARSQVDTVRDF